MNLREELKGLKRLVVKVGSNVITLSDGSYDLRRLRILVEDICELRQAGVEVLLVTSGAVNIGRAFFDKKLFKENRIEAQQAASSIGQPKLIQKYCALFEENNRLCSQILLTHDDFKSRQRYLNAKKTVEFLLKHGVTPILNENDTISFVEITVGDNDQLAAMAAGLIEADALLLITSAEGLFDKDPSKAGAKLIKSVAYGEDLGSLDLSSKTTSGRGGMKSKLEAVKKATGFGIQTIISSKNLNRLVLDALTQGQGTYFAPKSVSKAKQRKIWLASTKRSDCAIEVDEGAYQALMAKKSLLAKGVLKATGDFSRGECVNFLWKGEAFGHGITFFDQKEIELIKGKHSSEIEKILGPGREEEVSHTENIALAKDF